MIPKRERPHRLPASHYEGPVCVAFTTCERNRRPILAEPRRFDFVLETLAEACSRSNCTAPVFTLMPDHAHILLLGKDETSRALEAMNYFKWRTAADARHPIRWQKDYYDHIVRFAEGWRSQARYIALNPVRAGLVENPEDWSYSGSVGYEFKAVVDEAFQT